MRCLYALARRVNIIIECVQRGGGEEKDEEKKFRRERSRDNRDSRDNRFNFDE